jgi:glutamine synthetase
MTPVQTSALSPWLDSERLAVHLSMYRKDTGTPYAENARKWAARNGIVPAHRGRKPLYARADVDAVLLRGQRRRRQAA